MVFGKSDSSVFSKQYISNPLVQSIAKKVVVNVNPDRDANYPKQRGACVTVTTGIQSYQHEVNYPMGEPENPLKNDELLDKFEKNTRLLYSKAQALELIDIILNIENIRIPKMAKMLKAPSS